MATSSILGGERAATHAKGRDADALGPSDSSDSGSDVQGERSMATRTEEDLPVGATPADQDSDTDAAGTGERASAIPERVEDGADIAPDHIESAGTGADDADALEEVRELADEPPEDEDDAIPR